MKVRNILLLTYWSYKDGLVQSTLIHVKLLRKVLPASSWIYLFTLEQPKFKMTEQEVAEAEKELAQYQIKLIRFNYTSFGLKAMFKMAGMILNLAKICFTKNISHIQYWCTPAGAIGYFLSIMTGKPLIAESFEPHAEAMVESGTWEKSGMAFKVLFFLEKMQAKRAIVTITCVESMKNYALEKYGVKLKNHFWKPSPVDISMFEKKHIKIPELVSKYNLEGKVVGIYMGKFGGSYMTKEVFDFFATCEKYWGDKFRALLLNNHTDQEIQKWANASGFSYGKIIKEFIPHSEVPKYVGLADFGITPFIPVPSKRYGSPLKNAEYWATGLPVVIPPNISDDSDIIEKHKIGTIMNDFSPEGYEKNVKEIDNLLQTAEATRLNDKIRAFAKHYRGQHITENVYTEMLKVISK